MLPDVYEADGSLLGIEELEQVLGVESTVVLEYVELGLVRPRTEPAAGWRFSPPEVVRLARAVRLARELELHAAGAALLVELLEERERLRHRVICLERLAGTDR